MTTRISYVKNTDGSPGRLWHPTTGCRNWQIPVSEGCRQCWAHELVERRLAGKMRGLPLVEPFRPTFHPDRLDEPLRTVKRYTYAVSFFSDLFAQDFTSGQIAAVFGVMQRAPYHRYLLLTKVAARAAHWCASMFGPDGAGRTCELALQAALPSGSPAAEWDLLHEFIPWPTCGADVWLGYSVCGPTDVPYLHLLRQVPFFHRWLSLEPLVADPGDLDLGDIELVVLGGEQARHPRPLDPRWARRVRDQCAEQHVPFYFKQWSGTPGRMPEPLLDGQRYDKLPWVG